MRIQDFFVRGGGGSRLLTPQLILQFTEGVQWFYSTFSGGSIFFQWGGGGPSAYFYRTHITITCDFLGGSGPPIPPLDPHMDNVAFWHE